jgi:hypothetical protein
MKSVSPEKNVLNNSMEEGPCWETNGPSASPETTHYLWNQKVCYHVHNSLPTVPILRHRNPVHTFLPCYSKAITVLSSCLCLGSNCFFSLGFPTTVQYALLIYPTCTTRPAQRIILDLITLIIFDGAWGIQVTKLFVMQSSPAFCSFLPLRTQHSSP